MAVDGVDSQPESQMIAQELSVTLTRTNHGVSSAHKQATVLFTFDVLEKKLQSPIH